MHVIVIGVRHKTAPIEIREKLAFTQEEIPVALCNMLTYPGITEGAILSTCNRTEIYATVTDTEKGIRSLKAFLKDYKQFDYNRNMTHAFILLHEDVVMHLFRVASGLDSLILAEGQIMAQIKEALKISMQVGTSGEIVEKIFKSALSAGKAVRTETGIAQRDFSVARVAYELAVTNHYNYMQNKIAIIGAGKMSEILISLIKESVFKQVSPTDRVILINRTFEHTDMLAKKYGVFASRWENVKQSIVDCNLLFVATGSPNFILYKEHFVDISAPKVIFDLSVPRNVDPDIGDLSNITLYNTDNLSGCSGYTGENRVKLIQHAHQIIEREYRKYHKWYISRPVVPVITKFRAWVEDIRRNEVAGIETLCPHSQKSCSIIDNLSRSLVNKVLHDPTLQLKSTPQLAEIYSQAEFMNRILNAEPNKFDKHNTRENSLNIRVDEPSEISSCSE